jgi:hypothetical protein
MYNELCKGNTGVVIDVHTRLRKFLYRLITCFVLVSAYDVLISNSKNIAP